MVRSAKVLSWIGIAAGTIMLAGTGYLINLREINRAEFIDNYLNNPNAQTAEAYVKASDDLEEAADDMGKFIVVGNNVEKVQSPNVKKADNYLDKAIVKLSKPEGAEDYISKISNIDSKVLPLENKTEFTKEDKNLGIETLALSRELDDIAIKHEPNIHEILYNIKHLYDRGSSVLGGFLGTVLGGLAIGPSATTLYGIKKKDRKSVSAGY